MEPDHYCSEGHPGVYFNEIEYDPIKGCDIKFTGCPVCKLIENYDRAVALLQTKISRLEANSEVQQQRIQELSQ